MYAGGEYRCNPIHLELYIVYIFISDSCVLIKIYSLELSTCLYSTLYQWALYLEVVCFSKKKIKNSSITGTRLYVC